MRSCVCVCNVRLFFLYLSEERCLDCKLVFVSCELAICKCMASFTENGSFLGFYFNFPGPEMIIVSILAEVFG